MKRAVIFVSGLSEYGQPRLAPGQSAFGKEIARSWEAVFLDMQFPYTYCRGGPPCPPGSEEQIADAKPVGTALLRRPSRTPNIVVASFNNFTQYIRLMVSAQYRAHVSKALTDAVVSLQADELLLICGSLGFQMALVALPELKKVVDDVHIISLGGFATDYRNTVLVSRAVHIISRRDWWSRFAWSLRRMPLNGQQHIHSSEFNCGHMDYLEGDNYTLLCKLGADFAERCARAAS